MAQLEETETERVWELLTYWSQEQPPVHVSVAALLRALGGGAPEPAKAPRTEEDVQAAFGAFM